jgi:hypothetical protein
MAWPGTVRPRDDLENIFKAPSADDCSALGQVEQVTGFASATIHSVKGREFPAVVVVLPGNPILDGRGNTPSITGRRGQPRNCAECSTLVFRGPSKFSFWRFITSIWAK